jgi:23S rRNA (uracil1939-C5)-methyltransferase
LIEHLTIRALGHRGDGIAETADGPVFVPYTLPGEAVEVETFPGHPDRRHLLRVERPSAERIAPVCPHFGACGGCALQHWATARYREWKRNLVTLALSQSGLAAPVDELIDAHGEGRRAKYTANRWIVNPFTCAAVERLLVANLCGRYSGSARRTASWIKYSKRIVQ